jgi:hypothetical protein
MREPLHAGRDPGESLNDWAPVALPIRRLESPSSLALVLCVSSLGAMALIGALTSSHWVAALAIGLGFGVAIVNASNHGRRCEHCGRALWFQLRSSAQLDLLADPRRCERCQDPPLGG